MQNAPKKVGGRGADGWRASGKGRECMCVCEGGRKNRKSDFDLLEISEKLIMLPRMEVKGIKMNP